MKKKIEIFGIIAALILSSLSYSTSRNSNNIAQDALRISQSNFDLEKRPYLSIRPIKFKETEKYMDLKTAGNSLTIKFQFQIQNDGQLPAIDIDVPDSMNIMTMGEDIKAIVMDRSNEQSGNIALTQGDHFVFSTSVTKNNLSKATIDKTLEDFRNGILSYPMTVFVSYKGNSQSQINYKTTSFVTIMPSNVSINETKLE